MRRLIYTRITGFPSNRTQEMEVKMRIVEELETKPARLPRHFRKPGIYQAVPLGSTREGDTDVASD